MSQSRRILQLLEDKPGMQSYEIAQALEAPAASVGRDLYFLTLAQKVRREKRPIDDPDRPQVKSVFHYFRVDDAQSPIDNRR